MEFWDFCWVCGRKIPIGEKCYGFKLNMNYPYANATICKDCIQIENCDEENKDSAS